MTGRIVVVTGASRGIGKGTALAFAEQGDTVWITGRTTGGGALSIEAAAAEVNAAGGKGIAVQVDHGNDAEIGAFFKRVGEESGRIDVLVNNVYKIPNPPAWGGGFWDHPIQIWDDQVGIGCRAHYVASWHAAPLLFAANPSADRPGFICNVSSPGGQSYHFSSSYGAGKASLDRLSKDMAVELAPKNVACVSLYPGTVATEFIVEASKMRGTDLSQAQTPFLVGRSIATLAGLSGAQLMPRSGSIQWVEDISAEFDVRDENGNLAPAYAKRIR
jgi:dehydrogenase/reductase SDR family member 1